MLRCVACIQIVSANYRDLVLEGQQELYFATRWKLKPILLDGNGNSFSTAVNVNPLNWRINSATLGLAPGCEAER